MELKIYHLYPDVLNLYGDVGNIRCLQQRLAWRGIESAVTALPLGEKASLSDADLIFIGGGRENEQLALLEDIHANKAESLRAAIEDGVTVLAVGGGYELLGQRYRALDNSMHEFIGALDMHTVASAQRVTGNYMFRCEELEGSPVVAFENHCGRSFLGSGVKPLGSIICGTGNGDGSEGVRYKNVFGSYGHGPLLPKNPELADYIIRTSLQRKYGSAELTPLDDSLEKAAHDYMVQRLSK